MVMTVARQVIKPECTQAYYKLVEEMAVLSNQEEGCISYKSVRSVEDKSVHMFVECFKNQEAIEAHCESEYFQRIVPQFKDMFAAEEVVARYDVMY